MWRRATPDERAFDWYAVQHEAIRLMAQRTGRSVEQIAGVLAAISPGMRWETSLIWAGKLERLHARGGRLTGVRVPTYSRANVRKAWAILNGDDPGSILSGPKVTAFYRLLADGGNATDVCVDTHAKDIAVGYRDANIRVYLPHRRSRVVEREARQAYIAVARSLGVPPHRVQGVTWMAHKRLLAS